MGTHTLVIIMVSTILIALILAGVIADRREHRQPPASEPPGNER